MLGDIELYPHQEEARDKLSNGKILWGGVGSGKSLTAAAYYVKVEADADIYVITTAKKRDSLDWEKEFAKFGIGRDHSVFGGKLTVDSWNNIGKYRDVVGGFFIFDEQRLVGSGLWSSVFIHIAKHNRWILLSATPGDNWLDYIPVFIANGYYKNRTEFKRDHVVYAPYSKFPKVDRYINVGKLVRLRNEILVEMPYTRHTKRTFEKLEVSYDEQLFRDVVKNRWNVFENRPLRDVAELFRVMRMVVNSDSSRIQTILTLLRVHPRLIIFYNFNYELEALRTALASVQSTGFPEASTNEGFGTRNISGGLKPRASTRGISSTGIWIPSRKKHGKISLTNVQPQVMRNDDSSSMSPMSKFPKTSMETTKLDEREWNDQRTSTVIGISKTERSGNSGWISPITLEDGVGSQVGKECLQVEGSRLQGVSSDRQFDMTPMDIQVAEWNGHKHQEVPTSERWVYLVQYAAGAEGWNCTTTDAMCMYSLPYSYKYLHQAYGRIDRLNTPFEELYYYILMSKSPIDRGIWSALEGKRNFNESAYLEHIRSK